MSEILNSAIVKVQNAKYAFCRFITANDTGKNGSHQAGFYIPKCAAALLFDTPGVKGENKDKMVKVKWQDDFTTDSRFIYYGQGTRNEYRITRFGKGFPFFEEDNVGDLLIIAQQSEDYYYGFVLQTDQDIDDFFAYFNHSPEKTNQLMLHKQVHRKSNWKSASKSLLPYTPIFRKPGKWLNSPETYITKLIISRTFIFASFPMNNY